MKIISKKRCVIGEGPIWNDRECRLYFVNGMEKEICCMDMVSQDLSVRKVDAGAAAIAFDHNNRMLISRRDGVYILNADDTLEPLYNTDKNRLQLCNDMKVGPDGRLYVGTQSGKRAGVSDKTDGRLYSIDKAGNVRVLLDGLIISNGMEWSLNEKYFYHTDSDTNIIKEYAFDKENGDVGFTGRQVTVPGVDGFTIDRNGQLLVAYDCLWIQFK